MKRRVPRAAPTPAVCPESTGCGLAWHLKTEGQVPSEDQLDRKPFQDSHLAHHCFPQMRAKRHCPPLVPLLRLNLAGNGHRLHLPSDESMMRWVRAGRVPALDRQLSIVFVPHERDLAWGGERSFVGSVMNGGNGPLTSIDTLGGKQRLTLTIRRHSKGRGNSPTLRHWKADCAAAGPLRVSFCKRPSQL